MIVSRDVNMALMSRDVNERLLLVTSLGDSSNDVTSTNSKAFDVIRRKFT